MFWLHRLANVTRPALLAITALLSTLNLASCLSLGKDFSMNTDWIQLNHTTQMQVTDALGIPEEVGSNGHSSIWTYYHIELSLWHKVARKEIRITWNDNLTVHSYDLMQSPASSQDSLLLPSSLRQRRQGPMVSPATSQRWPGKLKTYAQQFIQSSAASLSPSQPPAAGEAPATPATGN